MDIKYKYYLYKYNEERIKLIIKTTKMKTLKEKVKGKILNVDDEYILLKMSKEIKYKHASTNALNKLIAGPIKITFKMFELSESSVLKPKYEKVKKRDGSLDGDKRNAQYLYITDNYIESGLTKLHKNMDNDLMKVAKLAIENKLEKRPLAIKIIDNVL